MPAGFPSRTASVNGRFDQSGHCREADTAHCDRAPQERGAGRRSPSQSSWGHDREGRSVVVRKERVARFIPLAVIGALFLLSLACVWMRRTW
jgi:hypothetical protein